MDLCLLLGWWFACFGLYFSWVFTGGKWNWFGWICFVFFLLLWWFGFWFCWIWICLVWVVCGFKLVFAVICYLFMLLILCKWNDVLGSGLGLWVCMFGFVNCIRCYGSIFWFYFVSLVFMFWVKLIVIWCWLVCCFVFVVLLIFCWWMLFSYCGVVLRMVGFRI